MPILGSLASGSVQAFGSRGLVPTGSALYNSVFDSLSVPAGTAFQYGTGDFTIEMWFYPTSVSVYGSTLYRQRGATYRTQRYLFLWIHPNQQVFLQVAGNDYFVGTANTCNLNAWNHVALVRRAGQMQIFLNGYANTPRANTTNFSDTSAYDLMFGSLGFDINYWFAGNLTNIRIAKSAYYITSFIPDRTPFTRTSQGATNVQLLLNFKNATGLATDSGANAVTVTNSNVTYSALTPFSGAFVTPPVVNAAAAAITPSTITPNEGDAITFNVTVSNTPDGTYFWTIELPATDPISTADISGASLSGSFTVTGATGSFVITTIADRLTEVTETFSVFVRTGSTTGIVLGVTDEITLADTSLTPAFTVTPTNILQTASGTFTANNLGPAGTYYWTVLDVTSTSTDFVLTSGSFTTSTLNGDGNFAITTTLVANGPADKTFQVQVRSGSTSGTVLVTSGTVTIQTISIGYTLTKAAAFEGDTVDITLSPTANTPAGTYEVNFVAFSGSVLASDFNTTFPFNISVSPSTPVNISISTRTGDGAESQQSFRVVVTRTGLEYTRTLPFGIPANAT